MQNADLHQLLYRSLRNKNNPTRHILQNQTILNGHLSHQYNRKVTLLNQILNCLLVLHFLLLHCYFQAERKQQQWFIYFLWGSQLCGSSTVFCLVLGHKLGQQYMRLTHNKEGPLLPLLINCVVALVMPKLQFNNSYHNKQLYFTDFKLNYLLTICSLTRILSLASSILTNSKFSAPRAARVCGVHGTFNGLTYAMRSLFKEQPFLFITSIFLTSVILFSFAFRIAECEFISQDPLTAYMNMVWMTTITMTTVGFGDYTPNTPIGRLLGVLCMSCGVFILSVMVAVLNQTLSLNSRENQALASYKRISKRDELKKAAAEYIRVCLWRVWVTWKYKIPKQQDLKERQKKKKFRLQRLNCQLNRHQGCKVDIYHEMNSLFVSTEYNLNCLVTNNQRLINFISEQMLLTIDRTNAPLPKTPAKAKPKQSATHDFFN